VPAGGEPLVAGKLAGASRRERFEPADARHYFAQAGFLECDGGHFIPAHGLAFNDNAGAKIRMRNTLPGLENRAGG
jgi:hypothetical protein